MKNKKAAALVLFIMMVEAAFTGCSINGNKIGTDISIGLVTDEGGINDKAFNQSANEGVLQGKSDFGISYTPIEAEKSEEYEASLQILAENKCNLTFAVGYQFSKAVTKIAKENPNLDFCIIDSVISGDNIQSIIFKEEEGSFLVGVIAGLMTKTNKVGFIGGKNNDVIIPFEAGFSAGVKAVNLEAASGLISADGKTLGGTVKYIDSFESEGKGYEVAKALYDSGCDIIYHAAGESGIGLFKAAQELKDQGKTVWSIGVDIDQAIALPEYREIILTSMVKRVNKAIYNSVKCYVNGNFKSGTQIIGIAEDGIGIADSSSVNTPEEILIKVQEFKSGIKAEKIKVPNSRSEVKSFKIK